jgi:hypothetical protein
MSARPPLPSLSPQPFGGPAYVALILIAVIAGLNAGLAPRAISLIATLVSP